MSIPHFWGPETQGLYRWHWYYPGWVKVGNSICGCQTGDIYIQIHIQNTHRISAPMTLRNKIPTAITMFAGTTNSMALLEMLYHGRVSSLYSWEIPTVTPHSRVPGTQRFYCEYCPEYTEVENSRRRPPNRYYIYIYIYIYPDSYTKCTHHYPSFYNTKKQNSNG